MPQIPNEIIDSAKKAEAKYHIPASSQIAQWAVESEWGKKSPGNNPFGIKALPGQPHVNFTTHEVVHGQRIEVVAAFRSFPSIEDAFQDHAAMLATSHYYARARTALPNSKGFCMAFAHIYATDPNYGHLLCSIIDEHNLTQYDR